MARDEQRPPTVNAVFYQPGLFDQNFGVLVGLRQQHDLFPLRR
jgi:hypothetical protein